MEKINIVVMIPSLNPDDKLVNYVRQLVEFGFERLLIINDGSSEQYDSFFDRCAEFEQCTILRHEVNKGKGRALKTGMSYYLENLADSYGGIVMGDADGQHALEDTANVARLTLEHGDALILGSRDFSEPQVPARSRFGNRMTTAVFRVCYGQHIGDTQTGLRGIPNKIMPWMLEITGERFEYEMNMLVECRKRKVPIIETPIRTIYIDDNSSSHFHPIRDSLKVYWQLLGGFIKYSLSSLACYVIEFVIYTLLVKLKVFAGTAYDVLIVTAVSRAVSSLCNFIINKKLVFHKNGDRMKTFARYLICVAGVLLASAGLVTLFRNVFGLETAETPLIKACVDTVLVLVSFNVQRKWVFSDKKN